MSLGTVEIVLSDPNLMLLHSALCLCPDNSAMIGVIL